MYTHERNYGCRMTEVVYRGLRMLTLENELLRVSFLVDKGTDIIEFLHKPTDTDFMWRSPLGVRDPATFVPTIPRPEGAFLDYYGGGWQECFPTGGDETEYAGTRFGPHGEICLIPWQYVVIEDRPERIAVRFQVRTYRTPFLVEKTVTLDRHSAALDFEERVVNEGAVPMAFVWGHHPAFGAPFLDPSCVVDLPAATVRTLAVAPTSRCVPGSDYTWPYVSGTDGQRIDLSSIPPLETRSYDMAYLRDLEDGWFAVTNRARGVGFGMCWPREVFKSIWYWQVFGGALRQPWYGRAYAIALEPWTTPQPTVGAAVEDGSERVLEPGAELTVAFKAVAYTGSERVRRITPDGQVVRMP